jgi:glutathione S-transferase
VSFTYPFSGLVTIAAVLVFFWTGAMVARARRRFGIRPPATSGDPGFERVFRVQMNTLEQIVMFLPALWLAAMAFSDRWAALAGFVWVVGRLVYARGYYAAAEGRHYGFLLTVVPTFILLILSIFSLVQGLLG